MIEHTNGTRSELQTASEIEANQNRIDLVFWEQLGALLVPISGYAWQLTAAHPVLRHPPILKSPAKLLQTLVDYATALFDCEVSFYSNDPGLEHRLAVLGTKVTKRVLKTLTELEAKGRKRHLSLERHGVPQRQVIEAIGNAIITRITRRLSQSDTANEPPRLPEIAGQLPQPTESISTPDSKAATPKAVRLSSMIECPSAARKLEKFLHEKGISPAEFAGRAQTTDRTLRNFRKTGRVRRDIFGKIAKAMGTKTEKLLVK